MTADEGPRPDTSRPCWLAQACLPRPGFGNGRQRASQTSDGAAVAVLMDSRRAKELGLAPMARLVAYSVAGCLPEEMGIGPIHAVPKVLKQAGITPRRYRPHRVERSLRRASSGRHPRALGLDPERSTSTEALSPSAIRWAAPGLNSPRPCSQR